MQSWQHVFRKGFAVNLPTAGLQSLLKALEYDDCRLSQGSTTTPPPLMCVQDWACEAADAITWCGWQGGENPDCTTVGECEEFFARACFECDKLLEEPAACRWFLNWFDEEPRATVFRELAIEVARELENRESGKQVTVNDGSFAEYALTGWASL